MVFNDIKEIYDIEVKRFTEQWKISKIRLLGAEAKYPSLSGFDLEVIEFISN